MAGIFRRMDSGRLPVRGALLVACLVSGLSVEAQTASKKSKGIEKIYTLVELLAKAEVIVMGEVGESTDSHSPNKGAAINVMSVLKAPRSAVNLIKPSQVVADEKSSPESEVRKRAEDLLEKEAQRKREEDGLSANEEVAPGKISSLSIHPVSIRKLPPKGTQAVFLLWEKKVDVKNGHYAYVLNHPQCVYDRSYAARIQVALRNRHAAAKEGFLRPWDKQMAIRINRREGDEVIKSLEPGNLERGLQLQAIRPRLSVRGGNTFDVTVQFTNTRGIQQYIYDGPMAQFGACLLKKGAPAESTLLLRATERHVTSGLDPEILTIMDATDFVPIKGGRTYSRELHFGANEFPVLATLDGPYVVRFFYTSKRAGKKVEHLSSEAWTGTLVSQESEIVFKRAQKTANAAQPAKTE